PEENAEMGQIQGMPLTFSWLPSTVGVPGSNIQYKFEMWEMRVAGIDPYVIAASMPTFYTTTQANTNLVLQPATLFFEPGMRYAWRVTASDVFGNIPFDQGGHSLIRTFTYQCKCDSVTNFTLERKLNRANLRWRQAANHTSFKVEVNNPLSGYSKVHENIYDNQFTSPAMDEGITYRMRVQAICNGNEKNPSPFSAWQSVTVPVPPKVEEFCPDCACGAENKPLPISNAPLRNDLQVGDTIIDPRDGGSRYILQSADAQGDGTYKGLFLFWIEIWNAKILCEYTDLSVNTDNQILKMNWKSVANPHALLNVNAAKAEIEKVADAVAILTARPTVEDTIKAEVPVKVADATLTENVEPPTEEINATPEKASVIEEYAVTSDDEKGGEEEIAATDDELPVMEETTVAQEVAATDDVPLMEETTVAQEVAAADDEVPVMEETTVAKEVAANPSGAVSAPVEQKSDDKADVDKKKEQQTITYLPWVHYAITEAKTMDGILECEAPLYSKGIEYHRNGGHNSFCPCGDKKSGHYCDPSAWCASFANWCLRQSGTAYTKSAGSQTFLNHAEFVKISEPVFGAIAVFTNLDSNGNFKTSGHVAFVVGRNGKDNILCLGGNQSDKIKVSQFSTKDIKLSGKSYFRGYYLPRSYVDKLKNYKTSVTDYTDAETANKQIINLNINTTTNESTR
ncbi:TIGR02594 family protein, partial [Candidatus Symbiothrix dinenymphae]|uniref:TIGR02594 family protein n=1 Tax=Candidatus Symbiothrix dinenymphae TaxID=467085 RepID=UPI000AF889F6